MQKTSFSLTLLACAKKKKTLTLNERFFKNIKISTRKTI